MLLLLLSACLYDRNYLDWVYTQLEDDDGDGFREIDEDCNDKDPDVHPGVYEVCDGLDNDCNGQTDSDALDIRAWYQDRDQDGYGTAAVMRLSCEPVPTYAAVAGDCNDEDNRIHPDAEIVCGEDIDRDCSGDLDNLDQDQDGYPLCAECADLDSRVHPGATERCNDVDDDCDGVVDGPEADERLWYPDDDGDGYGDENRELLSCDPPDNYIIQGGDCNELDPLINPAAAEICFSGLDENCDGSMGDCTVEGDLNAAASFVGTLDMGMGRDSVLNALLNAGDMDGDGHEELAFANLGRVLVQHGPFGMIDQPVTSGYFVSVSSVSPGLGLVVAAIGDVDGDGKDDLGLADPTVGTVYLLRTESGELNPENLLTLPSPSALSFGLGITRVDETLFVNAADTQTGESILYSTSLPIGDAVTPVWQEVLHGNSGILGLSNYFFDADGDGVKDLGTPVVNFNSSGRADVPSFLIFLGPLSDRNADEADWILTSDTGFALFPSSNLSPGDVTGDGLDDLWLVPGGDSVLQGDGLLYLVKPTQSGTIENLSVAMVTGDEDDDEFSRFVADDLNGDLQSDLIVGLGRADSAPITYDDAGSVRILYGPFAGSLDSNQDDAMFAGTPHAWTGEWLTVGAFNHQHDLAILSPGDASRGPLDSRLDLFWDAF